MLLMPCPWCGPRNVSEFHHLGEALERPDPNQATPRQWRSYLYTRANPAGPTTETWYHRAGCRRYFKARRDTVTNRVERTWAGQDAPTPGHEGGGR